MDNTKYYITCVCVNCKTTHNLEAINPKPIEQLLPGWIAVYDIRDPKARAPLYYCPNCQGGVNE